ncbi:hypothetical protein Tsubulata_031700, partial [Turnera subulata]
VEEQFVTGNLKEAYDMAKFALKLDPFNNLVNRYTAMYRVHLAATKKHPITGEPDWYNVLGVDPYDSDNRICHCFHKMASFFDHYNLYAAGADSAYHLISRAVEVLADPRSRAKFDLRWGFKKPQQPTSSAATRMATGFLLKIVAYGSESQPFLLLEFDAWVVEEQFVTGNLKEAYDMAKFALKLDPFNNLVNRYTAMYRVHLAATKKHPITGEPDWYNVLGVDPYDSDNRICHCFHKMASFIDHYNLYAAGADSAYHLISRAVEVLADPRSRAKFDLRWGFKKPQQPTSSAATRMATGFLLKIVAYGSESQPFLLLESDAWVVKRFMN